MGVVLGFVGYGIYALKSTGEIPEIPEPILWGVISTPGITALIVHRFWRYRRRPMLWAILIVAASINIAAMVVAHSQHWKAPVLFLSTITGLCLIVVFVVSEKLLSRNQEISR